MDDDPAALRAARLGRNAAVLQTLQTEAALPDEADDGPAPRRSRVSKFGSAVRAGSAAAGSAGGLEGATARPAAAPSPAGAAAAKIQALARGQHVRFARDEAMKERLEAEDAVLAEAEARRVQEGLAQLAA